MKKVLIITYYWPPAGGAGVQRVLKFAKYLPQFGWQPVILTVKNPDAPIYDESLKNDIPKECIVYHSDKWEPFDLYKKFTGKKKDDTIPADVMLTRKDASFKDKAANWVRTNLFIPDAKIGWIPYGVKKGLEIIEKENIDLIFSTSPPQTVGIIAKKIAKKSGLKWIADFRDPWMEMIHNQHANRSYLTNLIDSKLEKSVLRNANAIISVSNDIIDLFKSKIGKSKYRIIPNGYDESDYHKNVLNTSDQFTISYTGVLTHDQIPYPFIKALVRFREENITNFRIVLAGRNCIEFDDIITRNGLKEFVEKKGYIPHKESTAILESSDVLLLCINNIPRNKGILTGKLFEYFGCKKPIFAVGPIDGNANNLLKNTNSGEMVHYNDEEGAYQLLKKMYDSWLNGKSQYKFNSGIFSRKNLTKQLSELLNEVNNLN